METGTIEFWQAVTAISSSALILITGIYAYLTFRMARAAELQAWQINRASVVAKILVQQGALLILHVENIGRSSAKKFSIEIDRAVYKTIGQKSDIRELPFFRNGLNTLPPGAPVAFSLGMTHEWLNEHADRTQYPKAFQLTFSYETGGRTVTDTAEINVVDQLHYSSVQQNYIEDFGRIFPDRFKDSMNRISRQLDEMTDKSVPQISKHRSWRNWFHKLRSYERWRSRS